MVLFFLITLCLSLLGLFVVLGAKRYEMSTGKVLFARSRRPLSRVVHGGTLFAQYVLPFLARRALMHFMQAARVAIMKVVARVTLFVEHSLHRMLRGVQQMAEPSRAKGQVSAFLQEVADHKQKILRKPGEKHAIFERYQ